MLALQHRTFSTAVMSQRTIRVAVVGSGLAGLTAAYLLSRTEFEGPVKVEVHIFEKVRGSWKSLFIRSSSHPGSLSGHGLVISDFQNSRGEGRMARRRPHAVIPGRYVSYLVHIVRPATHTNKLLPTSHISL